MYVSHHHSANFQKSHCFIHLINASFKITYLVPDSGASPDSPSEKLIQTVRKVKFTWVTIIQNDNSMPKSAMSNILYTKHVNKVIRNIFVQFLVIRGRFLGGTRKYLVIHNQFFRNQNVLQLFFLGAYELNLSFSAFQKFSQESVLEHQYFVKWGNIMSEIVVFSLSSLFLAHRIWSSCSSKNSKVLPF